MKFAFTFKYHGDSREFDLENSIVQLRSKENISDEYIHKKHRNFYGL